MDPGSAERGRSAHFVASAGRCLMLDSLGVLGLVASPVGAPRDLAQYSTGTGSKLRQRYQVATERQGAQAPPSSRSSAAPIGSPSR